MNLIVLPSKLCYILKIQAFVLLYQYIRTTNLWKIIGSTYLVDQSHKTPQPIKYYRCL
jgi:hypothetical protein